jgi:hypothetical protein
MMLSSVELSLQLDFPDPLGASFLIWCGVGPVFDQDVEFGMGLSIK